MHAVKWSEPSVIESQLAMSSAVDSQGLTRAFQAALIAGTHSAAAERVVQTLIEYNAEAHLVLFDRLFRRDNDPYGVIKAYLHHVERRVERPVEAANQKPSDRKNSKGQNVVQKMRAARYSVKRACDRFRISQPPLARPSRFKTARKLHVGSAKDLFSLRTAASGEEQPIRGFELLAWVGTLIGYDTHIKYQKHRLEVQRTQHGRSGKLRSGSNIAHIAPPLPATPPHPPIAGPSGVHGALQLFVGGVRHSEAARCGPKPNDYSELCPTWTDLMMWAVVTGEVKLAHLLWLKTVAPMRAAVMASRMLRKIANGLGDDSFEGLQAHEQAVTYEEWACGVLNMIRDEDSAVQMLTLVPQRGHFKVWENSVMDQACDPTISCKAFVACSNCQELLERYYHGEYHGSKATIDRNTTQMKLMVQAVIYLLDAATLGMFRNLLPMFVKMRLADTMFSAKEHDANAQKEEEEEDLDVDVEYYDKRSRAQLIAQLTGKELGIGMANTSSAKYAHEAHKVCCAWWTWNGLVESM